MRRLQQTALLLLLGVVLGSLFQTLPANAAINPHISFQGKLTNTDGTNVTDGNYSIRFRIYTDPTADTGACANTCKWEETHGTLAVASGIFQVYLGSNGTALPGSVDFNASALYLGVKVGSDAEMTPRIRLSATPQAFNSDRLGGLESTAFGQLAATGQTWTGANTLQPTANITGLTVKQTLAGSPTADILNVQTANNTPIIQITGPAANEAAVTISSVGATRALTLNSGSGTIVLGASTLSRTASGTTTINLADGAATVLSVTNSGAGTATIDVDGGYRVGGVAGSTVTCSGGQFLQNQAVIGGITTGGTCTAAASASNSFTTFDTPSGSDPVADSAADTLQLLATGTNLTITGANDPESITFNVVESVLAGNGLTANGDALDINTGNGLTLSADAITIALPTATDALSAVTSSASGLQALSQGLTLLQGCSDTQVLKWNETIDVWACGNDSVGTADDLDSVYATDSDKTMTIGNATGLLFNLTSTGDFVIRDNGTTFATFSNTGGITFAPIGTADFLINQAAGVNTQITATAAPTVDMLAISNSGQASVTNGTDGLQVTFGASNASGSAIHITPSFAGGATDALTYNGLEIDGFSPTNAAGTDLVNGIKIGNITDPGASITSTGLNIGTGWDVGLRVDSGTIQTSNLGIDFTESDTNPACAAGDYRMYADTSETKLKKCVNGTVSDVQGENDVVYMSDATNTTWVDNNTTELWNGATQPNITPSTTGTELLVMVTVRISTDPGASETQPVARIDREIGSVADCTDVNTVGGTFGISDTDNAAGDPASIQTATNVFVDAPATASNVSYTVCTSTDSVIAGTNTETRTDFTIFPVNDAADLAEVYPTADNSLKAGEVVRMDPSLANGVLRSNKAYDSNVLGVVSTNPALAIGGRGGEGTSGKPIALSGRVPVKISTENGTIKKGDLLTASAAPGMAMKATKAGTVIGVAMQDYDGATGGTTMMFVMRSQFNGAALTDIVSRHANLSDHDYSLKLLSHFVAQTAVQQPAHNFVSDILADRVVAGLELVTPRLTADTVSLATIQSTTAASIQLNGGLRIGGATEFHGNALFYKMVAFVEKTVFKNDVSIEGRLRLNNDSGGFAVIYSGQQEVRVTFNKPFNEIPVVLVSIKNGQFVSYAYTDLTPEGFTIVVSEPAAEKVEFAWTATSIEDPRTTEVVSAKLGLTY